MTRENIFEQLKDILLSVLECDQGVVEACTEETNLLTDLGLSSIDMLCVVIAVEETFKISFTGVTINDFTIIGDVISYIEGKTK